MRRFLILAMSVLTLASCCAPQEETKVKKEMGIQLYSVRELIGSAELYAQNHETVLQKIAELGFTTVEAANFDGANFYGVAPEQFKADLEAAGLKAISSHTNHPLSAEELKTKDFSKALEWWKAALPAHKAAGMQYVVVPWLDKPGTLEDLKTVCDYFNEIGKLCAAEGLKFGYHSHSFEFTTIEDTMMYDFMIENTDPQYVFFQMDVYWAVYGRVSPVNYFKKYPGRFELLHIKDYTEVGQSGMVGFDAIFKNFDVAGTKVFIVEMEGSGVGDILETCRISADYLNSADFVKPKYTE